MLSVSPSLIVRSSLEEMLDSLRRRDDEDKPRDLPPALPARPTSRARLPAARRSLPKDFQIDTGVTSPSSISNQPSEQGEVRGPRVGSFGRKRNREFDFESPYAMFPGKDYEGRSEGADAANFAARHKHSASLPKFNESEWLDNVGYFFKKKLHVWCRLPNGQWELGQIQSNSGEDATILLSDGNVVKVATEELLPANPDILEGVDDLIQLSYLNEPSVLHNLLSRYSQDIIYSKAGPVLVAINPFKDVQCYGSDYITGYREKFFDNPHVYAVADAAYNEMITDKVNQSIIISGESGAGKTETAKVAMQYLAALGGGHDGVEKEILQTSYILEAFGNAKTSRNDNSSRFGKLIEIQFSAKGNICGAHIQTFLLEKSRVVQVAHGERSYHVFYQLCAGVPSGLKDRLNLKMASEYSYLNQSDCLAIDGVDDAWKFQMLREALDTVRICKEDQEHAFEMLAAVLWIGNVSFQAIDNDNHVEVVDDEAVTTTARLLGCSIQDLRLTLSTHKIQAGKDSVSKKLTLQQAIETRDALAKFMYASLFDWLVEEINKLLARENQCTGRSISILDIYGFESFKKNSFEQFCINYANERLQQHLNRHLFKLEQEEYELDGIDWTKVDFEDNMECLDLIEKRPLGLISLLDEESNFPRATDLTFANKLKQHLNNNPCFKGERGGAFGIRHYAGEVRYDTSGFLEKNRDPLQSETLQLLSSCSCRLPQLFASNMLNLFHKPASQQTRASGSQKQSVGTKFKVQLFKLMQQLESSTPHFICCIKPNKKQLPGVIDKDLVSQQLRCCGVLEVVRITRSGYPTRLTHLEFATRYGFLLVDESACQDPLSISVAVLRQFDVLPDMYQIGYRKLYFRTGQIAALEETRKQVLEGTLMLQKCFRASRLHRNFHGLRKGVITLQSFVRGENARKEFDLFVKLREQAARKTFEEQLRAVTHLQSVIRGWLARRHFKYLQRMKKSTPNNVKQRPRRKVSEVKEILQESVLPPNQEEFQGCLSGADATVGDKEQENAALREQLRQYETRWLEYEARMKSMEEMWQKQISSLQMSLEAAKKSIAADRSTSPTGRVDGFPSPSPCYYDSEDTTSMGAPTPGGSTPLKFSNSNRESGAIRETYGGLNAVNRLIKEFDQQKQNFDDDAKAIAEVKSPGRPNEELKKLKIRFEVWKKEYKSRLRDAKSNINKSEVEKSHRTWWGGKKRKPRDLRSSKF